MLIRRQSPDWWSLARDFRAGRAIDPARYVPDHAIPGFPGNVTDLVAIWNARFAIDFFTTRAVIADLSSASVRSVEWSVARDLADIASLGGSQGFFAFFHDDDDFFAPDICARLAGTDCWDHDTCVFPLYRIGAEVFTFTRPDMAPAFLLGPRRGFDFRFQSNNYAVNGARCRGSDLLALKDHVEGSAFADAAGLTEKIFSSVVSATVKTPASASLLPALRGESAVMAGQFAGFIAQVDQLALPPGHEWLSAPLLTLSRLLKSVAAGEGYDRVADLIEKSFASFSKRSASFLSPS